MGLKMDVGYVVPIAYDWGCDLGLCEKRFKVKNVIIFRHLLISNQWISQIIFLI